MLCVWQEIGSCFTHAHVWAYFLSPTTSQNTRWGEISSRCHDKLSNKYQTICLNNGGPEENSFNSLFFFARPFLGFSTLYVKVFVSPPSPFNCLILTFSCSSAQRRENYLNNKTICCNNVIDAIVSKAIHPIEGIQFDDFCFAICNLMATQQFLLFCDDVSFLSGAYVVLWTCSRNKSRSTHLRRLIDNSFASFFLNVPNSRKLFYNSTRFFFFFISPVVPSEHFAHIENRYNIVFRIFNCLCAPASSFTWWDQSTLNHIASFISVW